MSIGEFKSDKAAQRYRATYAYVLDQVWPGPRTAVDVSTSFGTTRVLRVGPASAEPIVLLPGAGGNSLMWHGYVEALAAHRTVIAVDTVGEAIEFAEHLHDAREILQRHARVSGFEPLQRGYRNTAAFSQGSAGQPPASASS